MPAKPIQIVGIGIACLDHAISVDRFPRDDRTRVLAYRQSGGGMAATAIVAAQRLGARCALVSAVGDDWPGRLVRRELRTEGIDIRYVRTRRGQQTFVAFCLAEATTARKMILGCPDRLRPLTPADVDQRFWRMLARAQLLHLDGWHEPLALAALQRARQSGVLVSFDATALRPATRRLLAGCDIVFASASFLRRFAPGRSAPTRLRALKQAAHAARWVGVTLGARGSLGLDEHGRCIRQPALPIHAVDTVGAGDAYHGAIAYAAIRGWPLQQAMRFASAVAAISCTQLSGRAGLPSLRQVRRFLARCGQTP